MGRPISSAVLLAGLFVFMGASASNAQFLWTGTVSNDPTLGGNWSGGTAPIGTAGTEYLTFGDLVASSQNITIPSSGIKVLDLNFVGTTTSYNFSGTSTPTISLYRDVIAGANSTTFLDYSLNIGLTAGSHNISVGSGASFTVKGQITEISSSSSINVVGTGTLTLGNYSTFSGGVTVNGGTLLIDNSSYDDGGIHGPIGSGTLTLNDQSTLGLSTDGSTSLQNNIALASSPAANVFVDTSNGDLNLRGVISGAAALNVSGGNYLTLSGSNTFTGPVTISSWSTVAIGNDNNLGAAPGAPTAAMLQLSGGTLETTSNLTLNSNRGILLLPAGGTLSPDSSTTLTYGGVISGTGGLTITNEGDVNLSGANTYTGGTFIEGYGLITAGNNSALGTGPVEFDSESEATLEFTTPSPTIGDLSGGFTYFDGELYSGSTISLDTGTNLTINQAFGDSYEGRIIGAGSLTKTGAGSLTLDGVGYYTSRNTYSGGTTINGGTLVAAADGALGSGVVNVNTGATLALQNNANLNNTVNVNSGGTISGNGSIATGFINTGGTLSPGSVGGCPIGSLSFNDLTLGKGGTYEWNSKDQYNADQVYVNYSSTLTINATSTPGEQFTLKLISLDGSDNTGPSFPSTGYETGSTYTFNLFTTNGISGFSADKFIIDSSQFFTDNYAGAEPLSAFSLSQVGNNIVLSFTPVPEPSTYALLTLGLASVVLPVLRRRQRT